MASNQPVRKMAVVKWWNDERGYGFLRVEGAPDVFVHIRDVVAPMTWDYTREGRACSFVLGTDRSGRSRAYDVRPTE